MPSGDVAAVVPFATATYKLPFQATAFHVADEGSVRGVQVIPSGDVAAVVPVATATNWSATTASYYAAGIVNWKVDSV
jgi:hypothetical protein